MWVQPHSVEKLHEPLKASFSPLWEGCPMRLPLTRISPCLDDNAMIQWLCWRFQKYQLIIDYALAASLLALAWWIFWFVVDLDNSLLVKHPALPFLSWQVLKYMLCRLITERKTTNLGLDWLLGSKLQHRCCFIILAGKIYYLFIFPFELNQRWCTWVTLSQGGISWASFSSRYSSLEFAFFI